MCSALLGIRLLDTSRICGHSGSTVSVSSCPPHLPVSHTDHLHALSHYIHEPTFVLLQPERSRSYIPSWSCPVCSLPTQILTPLSPPPTHHPPLCVYSYSVYRDIQCGGDKLVPNISNDISEQSLCSKALTLKTPSIINGKSNISHI